MKVRPSAYPAEWKVEFGPSKTQVPEDYKTGRETFHLKAGSVLIEGGKPLPCDVVWEQDIPITLRDGVVIYTDVLRPADQDTDWPSSDRASKRPLPGSSVPGGRSSVTAPFPGPDCTARCSFNDYQAGCTRLPRTQLLNT
jgi:predicted acyl esterase